MEEEALMGQVKFIAFFQKAHIKTFRKIKKIAVVEEQWFAIQITKIAVFI
jgi:hypothetical protein